PWVVHDGDAALTALRARVPDAVLLDIGLPHVDGWTVARQLRRLPGMGRTLVVAVSGYGREEDGRRSPEAGCDHHLVKPFDVNELQRLLDAHRERLCATCGRKSWPTS